MPYVKYQHTKRKRNYYLVGSFAHYGANVYDAKWTWELITAFRLRARGGLAASAWG